jgi:hypothetical protein
MIEKQYRSVQSPSPDEYVTYPEFSTVQLLLPCFVASFLDLSSENGVSQATKDLYVSFINRLLRSYEQQPVAQKQFESLMTLTLFEHMQSNLNLRYVQKDMAAKFNDGIELLLSDSKVANIITSKCMNYLMSCDAQKKDWEIKLSHPDHWCQIDCAWYSHLLMFLHRAFDSLSDCGLLHRRQLDLTCYCSIQLAWSIFSKKRDELRLQINDHVEFRTHSMFISYFGNNLIPMEGLILQRVPVELRNAAKNLTLQQLQSLNIYYYMNDLKKQQSTYDDRLIFPLDEFGKVFSALRSNDLLGLKLQMASKRNGTEDFSLITYQLAKNNLYYKEVMRSVTPSGKVIMNSPGEITFCPIKHCRWCGQANVKQFRVCPECKDNLDYPDLNFFCSETCEKQCLEKQHIEEHAKYLIMLIGLDINKIVRYE